MSWVIELVEEEGKKVTVIAVFRAIEGKEKDLEKELTALVPPTRRAPGCASTMTYTVL